MRQRIGDFSQSLAPPGPKKWGWELVANMRSGMKSSFFFFKIEEIACFYNDGYVPIERNIYDIDERREQNKYLEKARDKKI